MENILELISTQTSDGMRACSWLNFSDNLYLSKNRSLSTYKRGRLMAS